LSITDGSENVTNPNPRGILVCLSFIITESVIAPYFPKCLENDSTYKQINHTQLSIGERRINYIAKEKSDWKPGRIKEIAVFVTS
jgi:hypothetical protein